MKFAEARGASLFKWEWVLGKYQSHPVRPFPNTEYCKTANEWCAGYSKFSVRGLSLFNPVCNHAEFKSFPMVYDMRRHACIVATQACHIHIPLESSSSHQNLHACYLP